MCTKRENERETTTPYQISVWPLFSSMAERERETRKIPLLSNEGSLIKKSHIIYKMRWKGDNKNEMLSKANTGTHCMAFSPFAVTI